MVKEELEGKERVLRRVDGGGDGICIISYSGSFTLTGWLEQNIECRYEDS